MKSALYLSLVLFLGCFAMGCEKEIGSQNTNTLPAGEAASHGEGGAATTPGAGAAPGAGGGGHAQ